MAFVNSPEKKFERLGYRNELKDKYIKLLEDVKDCQHDFTEPVYDPEEIVYYGSTRERWHVDCRKCGQRKYTYTKELYMKRK